MKLSGSPDGGARTDSDADNVLSLSQAARQYPDRLALTTMDRQVTFAELASLSASAKAWLLEQGVEPGGEQALLTAPKVAVAGYRRLDTLVACYALIDLGQPFLLLHPRLTTGERRELVAATGASVVIGADWECPALAATASDADVSATPDPESLLALLPTSGTSGRPKIAMLSRRAFVASARSSEANLGWLPDDRWLLNLPLAHVGGLSVLTRTLIARRALALIGDESFEASRWTRVVDELAVSIASLVPTMLSRVLDLEPRWQPPETLRALLLGGARAPQGLVERARSRKVPVLLTYGLTEACSQVATQRLSDVRRGEVGVDCGPPGEGVELRLRDQARDHEGNGHGSFGGDAFDGDAFDGDADREEVGQTGERTETEEGEIVVRGPILFSGYWQQPGPLRDGWFATGDVGRLDEHGHLQVLDRRTDLIVTGGENVAPAQVEQALETLHGVLDACAFGVEDDEWGQVVAAAVVLAPGLRGTDWRQSLESGLEGVLSRYKRPKLIAEVATIPVAQSGKVDRGACRMMARDRLEPARARDASRAEGD